MPNTINDAWQQAIRDIDTAAISKLLADEPALVHQQIVHTRGNATTYGKLPLEMVNKSLDASKLLLNAGADPNKTGDGNALPIHNASLDVTEFLTDAGANVNKIGYEECTPLMYEVYMRNLDNVKLLIERGANVNYQRVMDGFCSLHFSAQNRDAPMSEVLLAAGADASLRNNDGQSPSDIARAIGAMDIATRLESNAR